MPRIERSALVEHSVTRMFGLVNDIAAYPRRFDWCDDAQVLEAGPELLMSHLACADDPDHGMNEVQLANFRAMTEGTGVPRSFAATGGILLGPQPGTRRH